MGFKDSLAETRESLIKSNHSNLAHSYLRVEERLNFLRKEIEKGTALLREIEEAADTPEILQDASGVETNRLYNKASSFSKH